MKILTLVACAVVLSLSQISPSAAQISKAKPGARGASATECDTVLRNMRIIRRGQYGAAMRRCRRGGVGAI
jgi:hypothetical protein